MRRLIPVVLVLPLCVGYPGQSQQPGRLQAFCVQYSNTTGFAGQGGRTVVFTAVDANNRTTKFVVPTYVRGHA